MQVVVTVTFPLIVPATDIRSYLFAVITFSRNWEYQITIQMVICSYRVEKERKGRRTWTWTLPPQGSNYQKATKIVNQ